MRWWHAQRNGVGGAPHHLLADLTSAEDAKLKSFIWIISQNWVSRLCFKESAQKQQNASDQSACLTARVSGTSRQGSLNFSLDRSSIYAIIRGFHRLSKEIPKADYKICILKVNLRNYLLKKLESHQLWWPCFCQFGEVFSSPEYEKGVWSFEATIKILNLPMENHPDRVCFKNRHKSQISEL